MLMRISHLELRRVEDPDQGFMSDGLLPMLTGGDRERVKWRCAVMGPESSR